MAIGLIVQLKDLVILLTDIMLLELPIKLDISFKLYLKPSLMPASDV